MSILPQTQSCNATALRASAVALLFLLGLGMARGIRASAPREKKTRPPSTEFRDLSKWAAEKAAAVDKGEPGSGVKFSRIADSRNLSFGMRLVELLRLAKATPTDELADLLKMADQQLTGEFLNEMFSKAIMARLHAEDPDMWLEIGIMLPPSSVRNDGFSFVQLALGSYSPEDLLAQMKGVKSKSWRDNLLRILFQRTPEDFDRTKALFESLDSDDKTEAQASFLASAAAADHARTLELIRDLPASEMRDTILDSIFVIGGRKSPEASLEQIQSFSSRKDRDRALRVMAGSWCETNKDSAIAYSDKIASPQMRAVFLSGLESEWEKWPRQERLEFIDRLPFRSDREKWKGELEKDEE